MVLSTVCGGLRVGGYANVPRPKSGKSLPPYAGRAPWAYPPTKMCRGTTATTTSATTTTTTATATATTTTAGTDGQDFGEGVEG